MKQRTVAFMPCESQNDSESEHHRRIPAISQTFSRRIDTDSRQGMNLNLLGQCCDLPAVQSGASCSLDYCVHCKYTGECDILKRAHGLGSCVWHLYGKIHCGMFEAGIPCGWGTRTWDDGVVHEGFWKGHKMNGRGLITFSDGSTYHGMLVDSVRMGHGIYRSVSGFSYNGSWQNDRPHGRGESADVSLGINYRGEWALGQMQGYGEMTVLESNGTTRTYEGSFVNGKREGHGVEKSTRNRSTYVGAWFQNSRNGIGTEIVEGKGVYVGQWKDDLRHGTGVFKSSQPNKSHYEGEWQYGLRHGRAMIRWNSGDTFECTFVEGKMAGPGVLHKASSSVDNSKGGVTLLVHSDDIRTGTDGTRATAKQSGTLQNTCSPMFFVLPATKNSKTKK
jgi:hypothetical protein